MVGVGVRGVPAESLYNLKNHSLCMTVVSPILECVSKAMLAGSYQI